MSGREAAGQPSGHRSPHNLGFELQTLNRGLAAQLGIAATRGAVIVGVRDGSSAEEAGLQSGDVVVEVDRKPVNTAEEALHLLTVDRAGGHLLLVRRGDSTMVIPLPSN